MIPQSLRSGLMIVLGTLAPDKSQIRTLAPNRVAPFEYTSGSSIKGKTKVSHLANKKIKALLNIAALSAKKNDTEMKAYYDKKVKEGKNKMLVLNSIRCKIISRAFAVIQRNTPFVNVNKFKTAA